MAAIYALLDDDDTIRYVGKTIHRVGDRRDTHWARAHDDRDHYSTTQQWLRTLTSPPRVTLLGVTSLDEWGALEQAWIRDLRASDNDLTNTAAGGEGVGGWKHTEETKERIGRVLRGKKRSQEATAKTASAHRGRKRPLETGRRISSAKKGKPWSPKMRAARLALQQGDVFCLCKAGPFQGSWGLLQHRRQRHD